MGFNPRRKVGIYPVAGAIQEVRALGRLAPVALDDGQVGIHLNALKVEDKARASGVNDELRVVVQDVVEILPALLVGRVRWQVKLIVTRPKLGQ